MASLGELFISLGFDVDDAKLKSFKNDLRDTHEEMAKLGKNAAEAIGLISAATVGLTLFVQNSADGAVRLNNMALMFGANAQAAQSFANALHMVNSQISITSGQSMFGQFSKMITGQVPLGQGAGAAISLLGGYEGENGFLGSSAESVMAKFAERYDIMKKQLGSGYGVYLEQAGIAGSEPLIQQMAHNPGAIADASFFNVSQENIKQLSEFAKTTARLDVAFNKLDSDLGALISGPLGKLIDRFTTGVIEWDKQIEGAPDRPIQMKHLNADEQKAKSSDFWNFITSPSKWAELLPSVSKVGGSSFNAIQMQGIMRALNDESGMNPAAIGDSGLAYGIGQWHPDRQANFKKWSGRDIRGSSREDQLAFVNYELTQGMEKAAGQRIMQAQTAEEAHMLTKKYYERPAGSQNIVINVTSNATDNKEVADLVVNHFQKVLNTTSAQTNLSSY